MMLRNPFNEFVDKEATEKDAFRNFKDYPYEVQKMLKNIFACCYRFNLYKSQTKHILNQALEPFMEDDEDKDLLDL